MAELTTTKLNAESHLLLDQPLLRLPQELIRRNFRNTQRYIEREREHILPALKDAANASLSNKQSPDESIATLDAMIARMQNLKRKLEGLHAEDDTIHEHSSKRIRHLQDLYDIPSLADVNYERWSRTRLDRLMVDYLLRSGYSETATLLASSKQITDLIDLDTFISCHKIASSLSRGDTAPALTWVSENRIALKKLSPLTSNPTNPSTTTSSSTQPSELEFQLRLQQFIELIRQPSAQKKIEAVQHAQKHLSPHATSRTAAILSASGLLAHSNQPETTTDLEEPYKTYLSPARWSFLSQLFIETHHTLLSLPIRPLLHVALSAGLSALKTPACHSAYNPASSSTPGHARIALSGSSTSLCPICSTELNDLAKNVPYAHHTKSYVESDPVVLPNGRIYGRERLEELQRKLNVGVSGMEELVVGREGKVRDPTTGECFGWDEVRRVYIT